MDVQSLLREYEVQNAKRLSPDCEVWELQESGWPFGTRAKRIQRLKEQTLQLALSLEKQSYLDYSENPQDDRLPGKWEKVENGVWVVPKEGDILESLIKFLYLGNWCLYVGNHSLKSKSIPDIFGRKPEQIISFVDENELDLYVGSFHDNNPWRVIFSSALLQK